MRPATAENGVRNRFCENGVRNRFRVPSPRRMESLPSPWKRCLTPFLRTPVRPGKRCLTPFLLWWAQPAWAQDGTGAGPANLVATAGLVVAAVALVAVVQLIGRVNALQQRLDALPVADEEGTRQTLSSLVAAIDQMERAVTALAAAGAEPAPALVEPEPEAPALVEPEPGPPAPDTVEGEPAEDAVARLLDWPDPPQAALPFLRTLRAAAELPDLALAAIADGRVVEWVRERCEELDLGLYERHDALGIATVCPDLAAEQADAVADWLRHRQSEAADALAARGLKRVTTSVGSPFEPNQVVPDPDEPARPTDRRELDQRVAGVRPGRGGWAFQGVLICPTRAQRYVYQPAGER